MYIAFIKPIHNRIINWITHIFYETALTILEDKLLIGMRNCVLCTITQRPDSITSVFSLRRSPTYHTVTDLLECTGLSTYTYTINVPTSVRLSELGPSKRLNYVNCAGFSD